MQWRNTKESMFELKFFIDIMSARSMNCDCNLSWTSFSSGQFLFLKQHKLPQRSSKNILYYSTCFFSLFFPTQWNCEIVWTDKAQRTISKKTKVIFLLQYLTLDTETLAIILHPALFFKTLFLKNNSRKKHREHDVKEDDDTQHRHATLAGIFLLLLSPLTPRQKS